MSRLSSKLFGNNTRKNDKRDNAKTIIQQQNANPTLQLNADEQALVKWRNNDLTRANQRQKDKYEQRRSLNPLREWTEAEDKIILDAQKTLGNDWVRIATLLERRTNVDVKRRWMSFKVTIITYLI